jgi:hypothetical protein
VKPKKETIARICLSQALNDILGGGCEAKKRNHCSNLPSREQQGNRTFGTHSLLKGSGGLLCSQAVWKPGGQSASALADGRSGRLPALGVGAPHDLDAGDERQGVGGMDLDLLQLDVQLATSQDDPPAFQHLQAVCVSVRDSRADRWDSHAG